MFCHLQINTQFRAPPLSPSSPSRLKRAPVTEADEAEFHGTVYCANRARRRPPPTPPPTPPPPPSPFFEHSTAVGDNINLSLHPPQNGSDAATGRQPSHHLPPTTHTHHSPPTTHHPPTAHRQPLTTLGAKPRALSVDANDSHDPASLAAANAAAADAIAAGAPQAIDLAKRGSSGGGGGTAGAGSGSGSGGIGSSLGRPRSPGGSLLGAALATGAPNGPNGPNGPSKAAGGGGSDDGDKSSSAPRSGSVNINIKSSSKPGSDAPGGADGLVDVTNPGFSTPKAPKATKVPGSRAITTEDFDLLVVIGMGAFGRVLQVRSRIDGQVYAMKVISKKVLKKKNSVANMVAERDILTKLDHPFLVALKCAFSTDKKLFLVMEYMQVGYALTTISPSLFKPGDA